MPSQPGGECGHTVRCYRSRLALVPRSLLGGPVRGGTRCLMSLHELAQIFGQPGRFLISRVGTFAPETGVQIVPVIRRRREGLDERLGLPSRGVHAKTRPKDPGSPSIPDERPARTGRIPPYAVSRQTGVDAAGPHDIVDAVGRLRVAPERPLQVSRCIAVTELVVR